MKNKIIITYTWDMLMLDCEILAGKVRRSGLVFYNIYGLPRGGLIPAVILSHLTGLPLLLDKNLINTSTLIVDDISDTGKTLIDLIDQFVENSNLKTATLWVGQGTEHTPTFFAKVALEGEWIQFPFETIISSKKDN